MQTFYYFIISLIVLVFSNGFFCLAEDTNTQRGSLCAKADTFENNNTILLDSLTSNVVNHQGFYQTTVGKNSNRIYGTILCRGDISANNCSSCVLNSTKDASNYCPKSRDVTIWSRWCFLRYANESFFGDMQGTAVMIVKNDTDLEDPLVSDVIPFMSRVAAATSEKSFMFYTEVRNINESEKRYGMAQCTRDISRKDCRRCLDGQLVTFRDGIEYKRRWEIYGLNCFMWYSDYQFYSNNVSTLLSAAWRPSSCRSLANGITVVVTAALLIVFQF